MRGGSGAEDLGIVRLVEAASGGDRAAFGLLVSRVHVRIVSACTIDGVDRSNRDDVLQEAILAIWKGLPTFRGDARFTTWMHTVARNAALRWVQTNRRATVNQISVDGHDPANDTLEFAELHAQSDRIAAALSRLPERERTSLLMAIDGVPLEEIARQFFASVGTVKSWNSRSRRDLRRWLAGDGS